LRGWRTIDSKADLNAQKSTSDSVSGAIFVSGGAFFVGLMKGEMLSDTNSYFDTADSLDRLLSSV